MERQGRKEKILERRGRAAESCQPERSRRRAAKGAKRVGGSWNADANLGRLASITSGCDLGHSDYNGCYSNERSINMAIFPTNRRRRAAGGVDSVRGGRRVSAGQMRRGQGRKGRASLASSRFDQRLTEILGHATEVFDAKGYEGASMRDLSRESGMSLAGLYYYFEPKEKLLYLIQRHTFTTILERLKVRLEEVTDAEMRICEELMDDWKRQRGAEFSSRTAALSLFGMMNWIYTWYRPRDGGAEELAREMGNIFLHGLSG